jgi:CheY-like chemotaxis protein
LKILIVDDSTVARLNAERTASKFGEVSMANNGLVALKMATEAHTKDNSFHIILLDLDMPGEEFLSQLREVEKSMKIEVPTFVIVISASLDKSKLIRLMQHDCSDYIIKPYRDTELLEKLFKIKRRVQV